MPSPIMMITLRMPARLAAELAAGCGAVGDVVATPDEAASSAHARGAFQPTAAKRISEQSNAKSVRTNRQDVRFARGKRLVDMRKKLNGGLGGFKA
jgi:predicted outer membrane protein